MSLETLISLIVNAAERKQELLCNRYLLECLTIWPCELYGCLVHLPCTAVDSFHVTARRLTKPAFLRCCQGLSGDRLIRPETVTARSFRSYHRGPPDGAVEVVGLVAR